MLILRRPTRQMDDDDLFGDDLFSNPGADRLFAAALRSWAVSEGQDPEADRPKKKKKKDLDFKSLQDHGYEPPAPIEESETYKRIQTVRPTPKPSFREIAIDVAGSLDRRSASSGSTRRCRPRRIKRRA